MTSEEELRVIQEYATRVHRAYGFLWQASGSRPDGVVLTMHPETWNDILCNRHFRYYGAYGDGSKFVGLDVFRDTNLKPGELRIGFEVEA